MTTPTIPTARPLVFSASESAELPKLHPFWLALDASTIRSIVYRAIGNCGGFEMLSKHQHLTAPILQQAALLPSIPTYATLIAPKVLHQKGFCLHCHDALKFPDGTRFPLAEYCTNCIDRAPFICTLPFWHTLPMWPAQYQEECINYLLRNRVFLIPDGEVYPIAAE